MVMFNNIKLLFILCVLLSCLFDWPRLFVQDGFTTGDVGANLFAVDAVLKGSLPYKDFAWNYGPLPLYYNAVFFKFLGSDIHSLIIARLLFKAFFAGVFFLAARCIMSNRAAFLSALLAIALLPEFKHNFSHYMGICIEIGLLWSVLSYAQVQRFKYIAWSAVLLLLLGLIKLNFGIVFLVGVGISLLLLDFFLHRNLTLKRFLVYVLVALVLLNGWVLVYGFLIKGLTWHQIYQCFPYPNGFTNDTRGPSLIGGIFYLIKVTCDKLRHNRYDYIIMLVAALSMAWVVAYSFIFKEGKAQWRRHAVILAVLVVFVFCGFHEFIKSRVSYQLYWGKPISLMLISYVVAQACVRAHWVFSMLVALGVLWMSVSLGYQHWKFTERFQKPEQYFEFRGINIYVTEHPKDIKSMLDTAKYLETNIPKEKHFYAFPTLGLYYYLAQKPLPDWLLGFYKLIKVTPQQEFSLIKNLESKKIDYIVQGAVAYAGFGAWGKFGKDYGRLFDRYMKKYFEEISRQGEWNANPERYKGGMGTRVFKRKKDVYVDFRSPSEI